MKRATIGLFTVAILAFAFLLVASASWAEDRDRDRDHDRDVFKCSNTFATGIVGGTIDDDVVVEGPGTVCYLQGVVVKGNVDVIDGAEFVADGCLSCGPGGMARGSHVMGNVKAENCATVELWASTTVNGNYTAHHCTGNFILPQAPLGLGFNASVGVPFGSVVIGGNFEITGTISNVPYGLTSFLGVIGGNTNISDNNAGFLSFLSLSVDTFHGYLQLKNNVSPPGNGANFIDTTVTEKLQCQGNFPVPTDTVANHFAEEQQGQCAPGVNGFGDGR